MEQPDIFYLITVFGLGLGVILVLNKLILGIEKSRKRNIKDIGEFDAILTKTPLDNPRKSTEKAAIESIENRFSIIKKLIVNALVLLWVAVLTFPFLDQLPATLVSVLIGSSAVLIGIAARPYIENFISGIVITFTKPFRIGDTVIIDGNYGTVEDITLGHTIVKQWNWQRYVIPNNQMLAKEFANLTIKDSYQWMHVEFWVAPDSDFQRVKAIAIDAARQSVYFSDYEDPTFWIMEMGKESVKCWVAAWANAPQTAWELGNDVRTAIIFQFQQEEIRFHSFHLNALSDIKQRFSNASLPISQTG